MKFYRRGIIWDSKINKPLCKFVDGIYETEDQNEIEILINCKNIKFENTNVDYNDIDYRELKKEASEKGIKTYGLKKIK